jgi:hypothetical protein
MLPNQFPQEKPYLQKFYKIVHRLKDIKLEKKIVGCGGFIVLTG